MCWYILGQGRYDFMSSITAIDFLYEEFMSAPNFSITSNLKRFTVARMATYDCDLNITVFASLILISTGTGLLVVLLLRPKMTNG